MKSLRVIILSAMVLALAFAVTNCSTKCCSPSLEVGVNCAGNNFQTWTWDPIFLFPQNPNLQIMGNHLEAMRPYLFKAMVSNYSNFAVHGVNVSFYWASFGLFDWGTPIGSVGVDLNPNESRLVSSPWSFAINQSHTCVTVRVFHPCDINLKNNYCWRNFEVVKIKWPFKFHPIPFTMDFKYLDDRIAFRIDAPKGIKAQIIEPEIIEGISMERALPDVKPITELMVKKGFLGQYSLLVVNEGANYQPGDTFDVTVRAFQGDNEISSFTVNFNLD